MPAKSLKSRPLTPSPLIADILCCEHGLLSGGTSVVFMCVPSHVGRASNSAADNAAKSALLLSVSSNLTVPHSDYKSFIRIQALKQWQLRGNSETENKRHLIEQG